MKNLILRGIVVGPVQTNCYFLKNKETAEILIVDPGAQEERIEAALAKLGGKPAGILLTHGHYDHICAGKAYDRSHVESFRSLVRAALYRESRSLAGRRTGGNPGRFFCNCTPYPGPYIRLLLLLAERGRSLYVRGYGFLRFLRQDRSAHRKYEPDERQPSPAF